MWSNSHVGEGAGRFAPTPTGALHVGNAYSALLALISARASGLRCHLRVDDLDQQRVQAGDHERGQLHDLEWLGLSFDPPPQDRAQAQDQAQEHELIYRQSARLDVYERALRALNERGLVYPCYCTRREVIAAAPHMTDEGHIYPGTCRPDQPSDPIDLDRLRREPRDGRSPAFRLNVDAIMKSTGSGIVHYRDLIQGELSAHLAREIGDFALQRRDGVYGYQLACAVDDYTLGCRVIARGADLIMSTHRQRLILSALGVSEGQMPRYAHAGLVVDARGERLAKRDQSLSLSGLREAGVSPDQLRASLSVALGGPNTGDLDEMIRRFSWAQVSRAPVQLSMTLSSDPT